MIPMLAAAAADIAKTAITADAKVEQQLFTNPATAGGVQSLGAITVGNRQVGGHGNAAGATSANPTASGSPSAGTLPASGLGFLNTLTQGERYALIGVASVLVLAIAYRATQS